jgi:small-conductance mechanosensitive channel
LLVLFIVVSLAVSTAKTVAQPTVNNGLEEARASLKQTEQALQRVPNTPAGLDQLGALRNEILPARSTAQQCIDQTGQHAESLAKNLLNLGPPLPNEAQDVTEKRQSLSRKQKELERQLVSCRLVLLQSQELSANILARQQSIRARELFARGPHLLTVVRSNFAYPTSWWQAAWLQASTRFLFTRSGFERLDVGHATALVVLAVLSLLGGRILVRTLRPRLLAAQEPGDFCTALMCAFRACFVRILPRLLLLSVTSAYLTVLLPHAPLAFVSLAIYGLSLYVVAATVVNGLLVPCPPAAPYLPILPVLARQLAHRLKVLLGLGICGVLVFVSSLPRSLPEPVSLLAHTVFVVLVVFNLAWIVWLGHQLARAMFSGGLLLLLNLTLLGTLVAEVMGYRNFSTFVLQGLVGTAFGLGLTLLLGRAFGDLFDGLDAGRLLWQQRVRGVLGLASGERVPGLTWMRLVAFVILWSAWALWTLWLWGLSSTGWSLLRSYLTEGFQLGSLKIWPSRLLASFLILALLLNLTRFIKQQLALRWLKHTSLNRGTREAMTKIAGYCGVMIAILVSLSIAGVHFQNLAIIAGALSVGIGFGLQNIVNNFVSGLILLFERPISTGDWVVVGNTEGYVRSINIRSTLVETFDRAAVIIPNSELISSQVTNWMLRDAWGRVRVPVGVAYGSDTAKVKQVLLNVGNAHPLVIKHHPTAPGPWVLFLGFGDSTLQFELRCLIYNVDEKVTVLSDLNFALDAAFREAGIEIAFPQRDIHIRDWPLPSPASKAEGEPLLKHTATQDGSPS